MAGRPPHSTRPTPPVGVPVRLAGAAFLVVLFFVPWDMMTAFLWVIGLGIAVSALVGLVGAVRRRALAVALACLASIALFPASCAVQLQAMSATMRRIEALATRAQAACDADGVCPDVVALCSGSVDPFRSMPDRIVGACGSAGTTVRYPIFYTLKEGGRRFSVGTRLNIDQSMSSSGGVGLTVRRSHVVDGQELAEPDAGLSAAPTPAPATP